MRSIFWPDVFCLSVHASYRCRHSGACCSSGWAIPVEATVYRHWNEAAHAGVIRRDDLPSALAGLLRTRDDGTCTFFDRGSRLCDIHREYGHASLPASCRQFPRVSLLDPRGVFVTLSHYCPTAADLLFEDTPIRLVVNPPAFPRDAEYDGLDARGAFPPLLRPGVLMDWDTLAAWDRFAFDRLDRETHDVDAALHDLMAVGEALRGWTPADGPLTERLRTAIDAAITDGVRTRPAWQLDADVRALTPATAATAPLLSADDFDDAWTRWVEPVWPAFTRPLCRYAAAKLCGNWCWYQGDGLRTVLRSVEAALAIVRVEAARHGQRHGRMLDRSLLRESVRQADLLLVHVSSREALARHWSAAEAHEGMIKMNTDDERKRALLTPEQYHVTQEKGTERAFTGKYWDTKTPGMYKCVVCGQELFDSDTKYDSGSGWPSFYQPTDQSKVHAEDDRSHGMVRTEVTCGNCGAHLGHVFPDGPRPTGLRYCINSASLELDESKKDKET